MNVIKLYLYDLPTNNVQSEDEFILELEYKLGIHDLEDRLKYQVLEGYLQEEEERKLKYRRQADILQRTIEER